MPWIKPYTQWFYFDPFFLNGLKSVKAIANIAAASVDKRKISGSQRKDLLHYLLKAEDPNGGPISDRELKAEALTNLIAGSDTTSNSITHIIDLLCRNPSVHRKLQEELDTLPESAVADWNDVKDLPYLHAVIWEALRYRTPVSFGLPRVVSEGGAVIAGEFFKEGTVVSCPTYTIHRHPKAFEDPDGFHPERWLGRGKYDREKYFLAFSYGPRACIGRNVATMELKKSVASFVRRFDFRRVFPYHETELREGFHIKAQGLYLFIKQR